MKISLSPQTTKGILGRLDGWVSYLERRDTLSPLTPRLVDRNLSIARERFLFVSIAALPLESRERERSAGS